MANVKKIQVGGTKYDVRDSRMDGTIGANDRPIYVNSGTPTQITSVNAKYVQGPIGDSKDVFLCTHPESSSLAIIPYFNNDIAHLYRRGGSAVLYSTTNTDLTADTLTVKTLWKSTESELEGLFNCSHNYVSLGNSTASETNTDGLILDITLPSLYTYGNTFYIDFGTTSWGFDKIDILVKNSEIETSYVSKVAADSTNDKKNYFCKLSHSVSSGGSTVRGFNRIRIHLYGRDYNGGVRIAQVGLINYISQGIRRTAMSRGVDDPVYRNIAPDTNDTYALGTSSERWSDVYGVDGNFSGILTVPTAAAGTNTNQAASCAFVQNIVGDIETLLAAL